MEEKKRFITVKELAELLQVNPWTANDLCHHQNFPARKIGRCWRIDTTLLQQFFDKSGVTQND